MKRFTDTLKWNKTWFQDLSVADKCLWLFICDNCDVSGVWDTNFKLASFMIGTKVSESNFKSFGHRVKKLKDGKYWLTGFIDFQYGKLSKECRPHAKVFLLIEKHGLNLIPDSLSENTNNLPDRVCDTLQEEEEDKDKEEDKEKDKEGGCKGETEAEKIYAKYPLKSGRGHAIKAIEKALKVQPFDFLFGKTVAYSEARNGNLEYVPHPATWFNGEHYLDDPKTWLPKRNGQPQLLPNHENGF